MYIQQGANVAGAIATLVASTVYLNRLEEHGYGIIAMALLGLAWIAVFESSFTQPIIKELSIPQGSRQYTSSAFFTDISNIANKWLFWVFITVFAVALAVSRIVNLDSGGLIISVSVAVMACGKLKESLYRCVLISHDRSAFTSLVLSATNILRASIASAWMIYIDDHNLEAYFLISSILQAASLTAHKLSSDKFIQKDRRQPSKVFCNKKFVDFSRNSLVAGILSLALTQLDKFIVSTQLGVHLFGAYSFTWTFAAGLFMLVYPINNIYYPRFVSSVAVNDDQEISRYIESAFFKLSGTVGLVGIAVINVWPDFLIIIGKNTNDYRAIIPMVAGAIAGCSNVLVHSILNAYGKSRFLIVQNIILIVIGMPFVLFSTIQHGLIGAAVATMLIYIAHTLYSLIICGKVREIKINVQGMYLKIFVCNVALFAILGCAIRKATEFARDPSSYLNILIFLSIYLLASFFCLQLIHKILKTHHV